MPLIANRSWTGIEIFRVHLRPIHDRAEITQAWVNTQEWKGYHPIYEARLLRYLGARAMRRRYVYLGMPRQTT